MRKKKAQIQMMETIAILFIFFILVFIALIFFFRLTKSNVSVEIEEAKELSAMAIAQIASSLPELQCSRFNELEANCVDILKMENALDIINTTNYFNLFSYSKITVRRVFPDSVVNWTIYDREPNEVEDVRPTYFPISLFDAREQTYFFGIMTVEAYT